MKSVDYKYWAKYICKIHQTIGKKNDIALEIASGNCILSKYLKNEFKKLYLTDISLEMLKMNDTDFDAICCNMLELPFKNKFDFIFSAFDSINYLNDESQIESFFNNIKNNLTDKGYFLFDAALKHNSIKNLRKLNRKGKFKGFEYIQKSQYNQKNNIHLNTINIKTIDGKFFKEVHKQKIYDFYYYFEALEIAGLYVAECFDAFTFENGTPGSDRVQFVVKRK